MWGRKALLPFYLLPPIHSSAEAVCGSKTVPGSSWPLHAVLVLSAHHWSRDFLSSNNIDLLVFTLVVRTGRLVAAPQQGWQTVWSNSSSQGAWWVLKGWPDKSAYSNASFIPWFILDQRCHVTMVAQCWRHRNQLRKVPGYHGGSVLGTQESTLASVFT